MKRRIAGLLALMCVFWVSCKEQLPEKPIPPTIDLLTPVDAANGVDIGPTFTWSATDKENRSMTYDFYIGPDSTKCIQEATGLTSPSFTLTDYTLKKENVYYWYIYVSNGETRTRSEIFSFRSIPAPDAPVLSGPAEGSFVRDQLTFSWEAVAAGEGETIVYEVFFGEDENSLEKIGTVDGETSFTYDPSGLVIGNVYYWLVKASDLINATASEPMSFKKLMTGAPDEPMIVAPENKLGVYEQSVSLSWTEVPDPESDAVTYDVYVGNEYPPSTLVAEGLTSSNYTVDGLETNKPYYWRVVAKDGSNNYTESAISTFTKMGIGAPSAPQIADLAVPGMLTLDETIDWDAVSEPDGQDVTYDVYVGTSNPPTNKIASNLTETEYTILNKDLSCDISDVKTYYCMVVAKDVDGNESNSVAEMFKPQMTGVFTDVRGDETESYNWVRIGESIWFAQGLRTKAYTNGNPIPNIGGVSLTSGKSVNDAVRSECFWDEPSDVDIAKIYPGNDYVQVYGRVYSYGCIYNDNFAPSGWHVANKDDVNKLKSYTSSDVYGCTSTFHVDEGSGKAGTNTYGLNWQTAGWRYPDHYRTDNAYLNRALNWIDQSNASFLELRIYNGEWRYAQYDTKMMFGIRLVKNQ